MVQSGCLGIILQSNIDAFTTPLAPDVENAADAPVASEYMADLRAQRLVPPRSDRLQGGASPFDEMIIVGGRGDRQNLADRLDPVRIPMRVGLRHRYCDPRSRSAIATYAAALRRMALACCGLRLSRSGAFSCSAIPVRDPGAYRC